MPTDASRASRFGQLGRLLARLEVSRIGIVRKDRRDLGDRQRSMPTDA